MANVIPRIQRLTPERASELFMRLANRDRIDNGRDREAVPGQPLRNLTIAESDGRVPITTGYHSRNPTSGYLQILQDIVARQGGRADIAFQENAPGQGPATRTPVGQFHLTMSAEHFNQHLAPLLERHLHQMGANAGHHLQPGMHA